MRASALTGALSYWSPEFLGTGFASAVALCLILQISGCASIDGSRADAQNNRAVAFNERGNAHESKGDHDAAIRDYDQAIRVKPQFRLRF